MPEAWPFLRPVTEKEAPGYFAEISHPMDLSTVRKKLEALLYDGAQSWHADLRLMLANALRYNRPKDVVYKLALDVGRALEAKVEGDAALQTHKQRCERNLAEADEVPRHPVRVAEGWSVPPPINHTVVRMLRARLRAHEHAAASSAAGVRATTPGPEPLGRGGSRADRFRPKTSVFSAAGLGDGGVSERQAAAAREEKIWRKECARALMRVWKHKEAWPFMEPVDPVALQIPTYFDIIRQPMDLGTIKTKLHNTSYASPDEFAHDMRVG